MRIAYVEDNPTNLALVERVAGMNHHVIVSYQEGEIALEELPKETFDLILMDVELAGDVGGLQVVRKLRADGMKTPIVAVTAYAMMGDRDRCLEAGCTDYLPKPLPINELLALLAHYDEKIKKAQATEQSTPAVAATTPVPEGSTPTPESANGTTSSSTTPSTVIPNNTAPSDNASVSAPVPTPVPTVKPSTPTPATASPAPTLVADSRQGEAQSGGNSPASSPESDLKTKT